MAQFDRSTRPSAGSLPGLTVRMRQDRDGKWHPVEAPVEPEARPADAGAAPAAETPPDPGDDAATRPPRPGS